MQAAGRAGGGETRAGDGGDARLARGAFARVNNVRVCHVRALQDEDPTRRAAALPLPLPPPRSWSVPAAVDWWPREPSHMSLR